MRFRLVSAFLLAIAASGALATDPPPVEAPPPAIPGQVWDATGAPASGATIRCRAIEEVKAKEPKAPTEPQPKQWKSRSGSETALGTTAEDGSFAIACGEGERFRIRVEHAGHAPHVVDEVAANGKVEVRLERGGRLGGRIVDLGTSSPIAGATARLCDEQSEIFGREACALATTDEGGVFHLVDLPHGRHRVVFHEVAHELQTLEDVEVPPPIDPKTKNPAPLLVFLGPGGTLRGSLVTHYGQPSAATYLQARPQNATRIVIDPNVGARGELTGEDGTFEFEGLPAGVSYQITTDVSDFAPLSEGPFTVSAGEILDDVQLVLSRGAILRFRLVDEDGQPVTATRVDLQGAGGEPGYRRYEGKRLEIGEEGQHTLRAVLAHATSLSIHTDCCAELEKEGLNLGGDEPVDLGTLVLDHGSAISGTVRDSSGTAVADASVSASWRDGQRFRSKKIETGAAGAYRLLGIGEEALATVSATKQGFAKDQREGVAAGSRDVDFVLERTGTISGTVLLPGGSPAANFEIEAHRTDGTDRRAAMGFAFGRPTRRSFEVSNGTFSVDGLDPGTYTVIARASGLAPGRRADLGVESDRVADAGTLTLRHGITITGRVVTSEDERPVPGAAVLASKPEMFRFARSQGPGDVSAIADLDGRFALEGLEGGVVVVSVTHRDHSPSEERIELSEGEEPPPLVLRLSSGGRLTGTVRDAERQPVTNQQIMINKGLAVAEPMRAVTDGTGRYTFEKLAPGTYTATRLGERTGPGRAFSGMEMKTAQVEEDETTVLDFDAEAAIKLSGRVLRGGETVPDVTLTFMRGTVFGGQPSVRSAAADATGRYSVGLESGGAYTVSVFGGAPSVPAMVKLEVPEQPEVVRDLELEYGGSIEGSVVDSEGRPIAKAVVAAAPRQLEGRAAAEQLRQAVTDAEGRYAVRGLSPGEHRVTAIAAGHAPGELSVQLSEEGRATADFELEDGAVLRGRIVDPQDNAVAGAMVIAAPTGAGAAAFQGSQHGTSGLDGAFEVTVPPGSRVDVTAFSAGWAPVTVRDLVADEGPGGNETLIRLSSGGRLRVTVTTADGRPASGVALALEPLDASMAPMIGMLMLQQLARQPTGSDGTTVLTLLAPGSYRVTAAGRSVSETVEVQIHEGSESDARLTVTD